MELEDFREALLQVMERKEHWAWPAFSGGLVPRELLHIHFEQEFATYVRDFPMLLGRAHGQCPVAEVRRELAENLYEEETGGLVAGRPHPELFLEYPKGLGFDLERFADVKLIPEAAAYRSFLDEATIEHGWEAAACVSTIFVEGTSHERGEIEDGASRRPTPPLEEHPLVVHYGLLLEHLALTKAHREVEGDHRQAAWQILTHIDGAARAGVVTCMERSLELWLTYRDGVVEACGIVRGTTGEPMVRPDATRCA